MQYSFLTKTAEGFFWALGKEVRERFESIHHMVPGFLGFYAGGDFDG
jgi:hypothetical protein